MDEMTDEIYSWTPTIFQIKDPNTQNYVGNVIGNRSMEDQIEIVVNAGSSQKETVLEESAKLLSEITERSQKLIDIMALSKDTMNEIVLFFGGTFVLGTSVLDSTPLG